MSDNPGVYDLGEIGGGGTSAATATRSRPAASPTVASAVAGGRREDLRHGRIVVHREYGPGSARPAVAASASLLLPGAGQIVAGAVGIGLLLLSAFGLVGALAWALLETYERINPTLILLELPAQLSVLTLVGLFLAAAALHIGGAVGAQFIAEQQQPSKSPHPALSGAASVLVPGWGQLLNGHRVRATFFLLGIWAVGGVAVLMAPPSHEATRDLRAMIPLAVVPRWGTAVLLTTAALIWALAAYDAVMGAVSRRR